MKLEFSKNKHKDFKNLLNLKDSNSNIEDKFFEKTIKYIKYIKWIPGIKMIGVGNSLSMFSATKDSDIDLLIVTDINRIWTVRIISTIIFQVLKVRKNSKNHAGRFCLSFFCTINGMNFGDFAIKNDIYLYFWIIYFKPILDYNDTYNNFIKINEKWANFDEYKDIIENNKKYIKYSLNKSNLSNKSNSLNISENILGITEIILKKLFLWKTLRNYENLGKPYGIIINNDMLKFHNNDKRNQRKKELGL